MPPFRIPKSIHSGDLRDAKGPLCQKLGPSGSWFGRETEGPDRSRGGRYAGWPSLQGRCYLDTPHALTAQGDPQPSLLSQAPLRQSWFLSTWGAGGHPERVGTVAPPGAQGPAEQLGHVRAQPPSEGQRTRLTRAPLGAPPNPPPRAYCSLHTSHPRFPLPEAQTPKAP